MNQKKEPVWMSWSTGKDSALALHHLLQDAAYEVQGLITTVTKDYDRVSMHGSRRDLLKRQAEALNLPIIEVEIPKECTNEIYEKQWFQGLEQIKTQGVRRICFGDLFLEDIRAYREKQLVQLGMEGLYPLWGRDTRELAKEMIALPIEAYLSCIDTRKLPQSFAGRRFDSDLLKDLPAGIDPCGENGEFHTFVTYTPSFTKRILISLGETRQAGDFCFRDLIAD